MDINAIGQLLDSALGLGLEAERLGATQIGLRAVLVYAATLVLVRLAKKRFMGRATAFDVILGIMLGSVVSRAVTGNAPFGPALVGAGVLVLMHWIFSAIAVRWHGFGALIKGHPQLLVRAGEIDWGEMKKAHMTDRDLWEDLRGKGVSKLATIAEAHLERGGSVSVLKKEEPPKVIEVAVEPGVQVVRIQIT